MGRPLDEDTNGPVGAEADGHRVGHRLPGDIVQVRRHRPFTIRRPHRQEAGGVRFGHGHVEGHRHGRAGGHGTNAADLDGTRLLCNELGATETVAGIDESRRSNRHERLRHIGSHHRVVRCGRCHHSGQQQQPHGNRLGADPPHTWSSIHRNKSSRHGVRNSDARTAESFVLSEQSQRL